MDTVTRRTLYTVHILVLSDYTDNWSVPEISPVNSFDFWYITSLCIKTVCMHLMRSNFELDLVSMWNSDTVNLGVTIFIIQLIKVKSSKTLFKHVYPIQMRLLSKRACTIYIYIYIYIRMVN